MTEQLSRRFNPSWLAATVAAIVALASVATFPTDVASQISFQNSTAIIIPDLSAASPFPSSIEVSGLPGTTTRVVATLHGFSHTFTEDVQVLLVSPTNQKIMLMSGAGGGTQSSGLNLSFASDGIELPPETSLSSTTYRPENFFSAEDVPAPGPPRPYSTDLTSLNGLNPNGTWRMYVADLQEEDTGSISGGWSLRITTSGVSCSSSAVAGTVDVRAGAPESLNVTITARSGPISRLVFHAGGADPRVSSPNALVDIGGVSGRSGEFSYDPPGGPSQVQFTLRRAGAGGATLPMEVIDACGTWSTIVGGGQDAWGGGSAAAQSVSPGAAVATATPVPTATPTATPTRSANESPRGTTGGAPSATPTAIPTPGAACAGFSSHAQAQARLRSDPRDPLLIDRNRNGIACEGSDGAGFMNQPLDMTPVPRP